MPDASHRSVVCIEALAANLGGSASCYVAYEEPAHAARYYRWTYKVLLATCFVDCVEFTVIMPTLYAYVSRLVSSNPEAWYGYITGAYYLLAVLSQPFLGRWADSARCGYRKVFVATTALAGLGQVIYLTAGMVASRNGAALGLSFATLGRLMTGLSAANSTLVDAYILQTCPYEHRCSWVSRVMIIRKGGIMLGPLFNFITRGIVFDWHGLSVDECNSPALLMAVLLFILCMAQFCIDEPHGREAERRRGSGDWKEPAACKVSNFTLMSAGLLCNLLGSLAALLWWTRSMRLSVFYAVLFLLVSGVPFTSTSVKTMFSTIASNSGHDGLLAQLRAVCGSLGGLFGPMWVGWTLKSGAGDHVARETFIGIVLVMAAASLLSCCSIHRSALEVNTQDIILTSVGPPTLTHLLCRPDTLALMFDTFAVQFLYIATETAMVPVSQMAFAFSPLQVSVVYVMSGSVIVLCGLILQSVRPT